MVLDHRNSFTDIIASLAPNKETFCVRIVEMILDTAMIGKLGKCFK